jgi:membrane associated rhomboid family serine protease
MNGYDFLRHPPTEPEPEQWVLVAKAHPADLSDYSLVLSAIGIEHQVNRQAGAVFVRRHHSARAMAELQAFRVENRNWPTPTVPPPPFVRSGSRANLFMLGLLIFIYLLTGPWAADSPWFRAGAINSKAILEQGQWQRLLTALTLHADQMHLVGNCVIGGFIAQLLCKSIGSGTAWLTLLLSGLLGNLLNIVFRSEPHYSVGFSTAIFAAIGILCGRQLVSPGPVLRQLLLPLGAGVGLLAMLGSSNESGRTDLGAHLFGLFSGLILGLLLRLFKFDQQGEHKTIQQGLFISALLLIVFCWLLAFQTEGWQEFGKYL